MVTPAVTVPAAASLEAATAVASPRSPRGGATRHRAMLAGYLFVAPGFALYALVMLYPAVRALIISFQEYRITPGADSPFVGLDNYVRAIADPILQQSFINAGVYMIATVPAQMIIGLAIAVLLDAPLRGRTGFRVLFYLPVVTSWVVVSLLFQFLFGTDRGIVNWILVEALSVLPENVNWLGERWTALFAISILGVWKGVGWSMLIFLAALAGVPRELHEAAALDGANGLQRFRYITLPFIRGTTTTVAILLVIGGFNVFTSVLLMTGGGPLNQTQVPLTYMYQQAFEFLDFGYGSAISFLLTLVVLAFAAIQWGVSRRRGRDGLS